MGRTRSHIKLLSSLLLIASLSFAQTSGEKVLWLAGSSVAFSLFDYVGYNMTLGTPAYRAAQFAVQIAISYILYEKFGLPTAIGFNLVWWTWGCDLLYYQWGRVLPPYDRLDSGKQVSWASWTPAGFGKRIVPHDTLIAQSLVGAVLAFTITVTL